MGNEPGDSTASSTTNDHPKPRNPSRTGELAEAAFLHKVTQLGFGVATPWGNSERYDFILDNGQRLWRVQLKCTEVLRARGYDVQPIYSVYGKGKHVYTPDDIDVLVALITPLDAWYVLPIESFSPCKSLRFYPTGGCTRPRFEQYREAWHLLRPEPEFISNIQASADPLFSHICHSDPCGTVEPVLPQPLSFRPVRSRGSGENEGGIRFPQPPHNCHTGM